MGFGEIDLIVLNNPGIKIAQVAELRGKSESTVWKQLNELMKKGIIEYRGSAKWGNKIWPNNQIVVKKLNVKRKVSRVRGLLLS